MAERLLDQPTSAAGLSPLPAGPIATTTTHRPHSNRSRLVLRTVAVAYVVALVLAPVLVVCWRTVAAGGSAFLDAWTSAATVHAVLLTAQVAAIAVVINTVFGVGVGLLLARYEFRGKRILDVLVDLPISVSPIIVGLALILVYGEGSELGWFGGALAELGVQIIYTTTGMALATTFVTLPLVLREVVPVLVEAGTDQEQAARSLGANAWQRFWRITLPTIRWALSYGVVLSVARAIGEFGAVKVVSSLVIGQSQTLTLRVDELAEQLEPGYYQISLVMIAFSVLCIAVISLLKPKGKT